MTIYDIIYKKRNGNVLSCDEIEFAVSGYTKGEIPDYQMSALLMAIFIRGLNDDETSFLTNSMTKSGDVLDLSDISGAKVDKHSTGGVGDGTSIVLAPLAASCGIIVPMMSGRGLGHTGGTLDKLESIPGFTTNLSEIQYRRQLRKIGACMIGQTDRIAPADKKIYALRDVTATVDSIPLISASIMSKKLAEGCDALVLDVKTGSGAFMKNIEGARALAKTMISIGRNSGKEISALITDMNQPLGNAVGNALEVRQAIEVLKGGGPQDFINLTIELGAKMLMMADTPYDKESARKVVKENLGNSKALSKFQQIVEYQGGNPHVIDAPERLLQVADNREDILSPNEGYIQAIDTEAVGMSSVLLGAGRRRKEDKIDYGAGIIIKKKLGEKVAKGEAIAEFYYNDDSSFAQAKERFLKAFNIGETPPKPLPLVYEEL